MATVTALSTTAHFGNVVKTEKRANDTVKVTDLNIYFDNEEACIPEEFLERLRLFLNNLEILSNKDYHVEGIAWHKTASAILAVPRIFRGICKSYVKLINTWSKVIY